MFLLLRSDLPTCRVIDTSHVSCILVGFFLSMHIVLLNLLILFSLYRGIIILRFWIIMFTDLRIASLNAKVLFWHNNGAFLSLITWVFVEQTISWLFVYSTIVLRCRYPGIKWSAIQLCEEQRKSISKRRATNFCLHCW